MKRSIFAVVFVCLFATFGFGDPNTQISSTTTDFGSGHWQYIYDVKNISLSSGLKEFTIWFGYGSYGNLTIETLNPLAGNWDEIVWQPEPLLHDDGGYDALAKNLNIGVNETVHGFAVSFDWLGTGTPGPQFYEIIDPDHGYVTIESGYTVPEPGTLILFGLGGLFCRRVKPRLDTF